MILNFVKKIFFFKFLFSCLINLLLYKIYQKIFPFLKKRFFFEKTPQVNASACAAAKPRVLFKELQIA